jgi:uncharacterized membrane protein YfcA
VPPIKPPALDLLGLTEPVTNGPSRSGVVAFGLVVTIHVARLVLSLVLINWREGSRVVVLTALGTVTGSFAAVDLSAAVLEAMVVRDLLVVLALLLSREGRWLEGRGGH